MATPPETNPAPPVDIGALIARSPNFRDNEPHIAGTGVSVKRIAGWHHMGYAPEQIAADYGHLTLAQVYAALTYYYANQAEIDDLLAEEERLYDELAAQYKPAKQITP